MIRRAIASMSHSLGAKVLAPVGVGCLVMIVGVFFGVREMGTQLALDRLSQRAQAIATMVSLAAETIQSQEQLERLVYSLGAERDVAQILVAGRSPRRVVASTRNEWNGRGGEVEELRRSFAEMERTLLTNRGSVELHSEIGEMDCKHPLLLRSSEGLVPGVVMVHIDAKPLFAAVQQWAVLGAMAAAGLAGATFLGVAYLVTRVVLSPLRAIVGAIAKDAPAAVMTHDEVGLLAEAFNARRAETARVRGSLEGALREIGALRTALDEHSILSITDSCGRIVDVNSGFCTLTGYSRGELLGNSHRILKSGAHPDGYWAEMWGQVKRGRAWRGEVCDRRKDGRLVWTDTTIVPCLDGTGEVEKYVAIRFDVTEQKLARAKIAESEARFRTLVEGAGVVVWEYDFGGGCFSYVSSQAIGLGYPLEEWLKPGFWEAHIHEEDRARAVAGRNRESGAGRSHRLRYRMLEASGEVVHVEEVVSVEMSGEKPVAMRGVLIDITPQVVREKVVQEQAERLDLTVNAAQLGTWDWDLPSGEVTFNEVAETMLGYEPGSWESHVSSWAERVHPEDLEQAGAVLEAHLRGDTEAYQAEFRMRRADGTWAWIMGFGRATRRDATGRALRLVGVNMDVTERKEAAEALREASRKAEAASRAKSDFLANMSHEIRTPMTAILGYADLLSEQCGSGEDARRAEYVGTIKRNGEHLLSIINDILDISKIEAGKMTVELVRVDPMGLLREIEQLMSVKAQAKGIALGVEQECPLPAAVVTDAVRLRQVLVNLVGNAIKFTEVGGVRIRVGLCGDASGGQLLRVRVTDSGIGMTQSQVDGLFEAFHQADSSVTRRFGGTGLGLRISRSLAEMLGGTVTATSEPGVGSEFTLTVALRPDLNVPTAGDEHPPVFVSGSATGPAANLAGVRIFLAEDGPDNQRLISFHLRKAGAEVRVFENGRVALEAMTADGTAEGTLRDPPPCDLLLTDMQMPEMDGYTLASVLRERGSKLPIVALTAHAMGGDAEKCISAGCDAYATKPIDRERLVSICAAAAFSPRRA